MSAAPASPGKVCVVCRTDVANLDRMKDPQGHYYCKPCYAGARQKAAAKQGAIPTPAQPVAKRPAAATAKPVKPAPRPAPRLDGFPVAKLVDDLPSLDELNDFEFSASSGPTCPSCAGPMAADAILCTGCGYNRTTGGHISTGIGVPPPVKIVKSGRGSAVGTAAGAGMANLIRQPWMFGVGSLAFFLLFFLSAKANDSLLKPYVMTQSAFSLVIGIWLLVVAFKDAVVQGLLCLVTCGFYALYYCYARQDNPHLKWGYTVSIISYLMGYSLVGAAMFRTFSDSPYQFDPANQSTLQNSFDANSDGNEPAEESDGGGDAEMTDDDSGSEKTPAAAAPSKGKQKPASPGGEKGRPGSRGPGNKSPNG